MAHSRITRFGAAAAFALAALLAGSCSPRPQPNEDTPSAAATKKNTDWVRDQFLELETSGSAMGDVIGALRSKQPDLYEQFIATVGEEISNGKTPFEAGAAARPVYLAKLTELMQTASDDDILEAVSLSRDQMVATLEIDPQLCVKLTRGEADERLGNLSPDLTDRELRLSARILERNETENAAVSAEEFTKWSADYLSRNSELTFGLQMLELPVPTDRQATAICNANIGLFSGFQAEEPETQARLFRRALRMASGK